MVSGERLLVTGQLGGEPIGCAGTGDVTLSCSNLFGNAGGDWVGCVAGDDGGNDNVSVDPRYCDAPGNDFSLASNSPALASCGTIGALGAGCGPIPLTVTITPDGLGDYPTIQAAIRCLPPRRQPLTRGRHVHRRREPRSRPGRQVARHCRRRGLGRGRDPRCRGHGGRPAPGHFWFHSGEDSTAVIENLTLVGGYALDAGGAVRADSSSTPTLRTLVIRDCVSETAGGAIAAADTSDLTLADLTLVRNDAPVGAAVYATDSAVSGERLLVTDQLGGEPIACVGIGDVSLSCSNVFGNAGGDWVGCVAGEDAIDDNLSVDPRYCDPAGDDFSLAANSPALASCGTAGALGVGCAAQSVLVISPDGLGDYPTIQAGIDAAVPGDTLSLGIGTFSGPGNRDLDFGGKNLTLLGAGADPAAVVLDAGGSMGDPHRHLWFHSGEDSTSVIENVTLAGGYATDEGGAVRADSVSSPTLRSLIIRDCVSEVAGGAIAVRDTSDLTLEALTLVRNDAPAGSALHATDATLTGARLLVTDQLGGEPVVCVGIGDVDLSCSNLFGNAGGDWVGCVAGDEAANDNLSADPRYCDAAGDDFALAANSPALAFCGTIGALGSGCGPIALTATITPDGLGDYPTIQAAVDASLPGDSLSLGVGTFTGAGNRDLDLRGKSLAIAGAGASAADVILDAGGTMGDPHRHFWFHSGEDTTAVVENLTLIGGYVLDSGGSIRADSSSTPSLRDLVIRDCVAETAGGAIAAALSSNLALADLTLVSNDAPVGAAVYADDSSITAERLLITDQLGGEPVACAGTGDVALSCSNVFGNAGGDWVDCIAGDDAANDNLSRRPTLLRRGRQRLLAGRQLARPRVLGGTDRERIDIAGELATVIGPRTELPVTCLARRAYALCQVSAPNTRGDPILPLRRLAAQRGPRLGDQRAQTVWRHLRAVPAGAHLYAVGATKKLAPRLAKMVAEWETRASRFSQPKRRRAALAQAAHLKKKIEAASALTDGVSIGMFARGRGMEVQWQAHLTGLGQQLLSMWLPAAPKDDVIARWTRTPAVLMRLIARIRPELAETIAFSFGWSAPRGALTGDIGILALGLDSICELSQRVAARDTTGDGTFWGFVFPTAVSLGLRSHTAANRVQKSMDGLMKPDQEFDLPDRLSRFRPRMVLETAPVARQRLRGSFRGHPYKVQVFDQLMVLGMGPGTVAAAVRRLGALPPRRRVRAGPRTFIEASFYPRAIDAAFAAAHVGPDHREDLRALETWRMRWHPLLTRLREVRLSGRLDPRNARLVVVGTIVE